MVGEANHVTMREDRLHRIDSRFASIGIEKAKDLGQGATQGVGQHPSAKTLRHGIHPGHPADSIRGDHRVADRVQGDGEIFFAFLQSVFTLAQG
jgi:hypothetical protein